MKSDEDPSDGSAGKKHMFQEDLYEKSICVIIGDDPASVNDSLYCGDVVGSESEAG